MDKPVNDKAARPAEAPLSEREKNVIIAGVLLSMLLAALDQTIVARISQTGEVHRGCESEKVVLRQTLSSDAENPRCRQTV